MKSLYKTVESLDVQRLTECLHYVGGLKQESLEKAKKYLPTIWRLDTPLRNGRRHIIDEESYKMLFLEFRLTRQEVGEIYGINAHVCNTSNIYYSQYSEEYNKCYGFRLHLRSLGNTKGKKDAPYILLEYEKLKSLIEEGYSIGKIAKILNVSEFIVKRNILHYSLTSVIPKKSDKFLFSEKELSVISTLLGYEVIESLENYSEYPEEVFTSLYSVYLELIILSSDIRDKVKKRLGYYDRSTSDKLKQISFTTNKHEALLARALIDLGIQHTRQAKIGKYAVDFLIEDKGLIIEIDGEYHDTDSSTIERDRKREILFKEKGFNIVKFTTKEINTSLGEVICRIKQLL